MSRHFDDLRDSGLAGGLVLMGASAIVMVFVGGLGGARLGRGAVFLVLSGGFLIGAAVHRVLLRTTGIAARRLLAIDGESTPYQPTFSGIETLEVRGDLPGAERAWGGALERHPGNAYVLMRVAEFHLRLKRDPVTALGYFEAIRDLPTAGRELGRYAAQKIVDLYLGPLADEGKAMVALRRLIDRYPDSREAEEARGALARLKAARPRPD